MISFGNQTNLSCKSYCWRYINFYMTEISKSTSLTPESAGDGGNGLFVLVVPVTPAIAVVVDNDDDDDEDDDGDDDEVDDGDNEFDEELANSDELGSHPSTIF
ncbi:hypothetical protein DERP_010399 [Dermatophagoides pteronyssinus]|uniref:Uncharacterized protein n=1 Tax=Dermatophagoides pteronyssinus TaxID=6956 RepID=A0ABQ8J5E0_DERPT|nr:hypothetical protein DERP_010399 [Dermatophagoides pteronyssinus]